MTEMNEHLAALKEVDIDPKGIFKYILLKVYDNESKTGEPSKLVVRGSAKFPEHADIVENFLEVAFIKNRLDCDILGGGKINHEPERKHIKIYGYSQGFGKAKHEVTAGVLKKFYTDYTFECTDDECGTYGYDDIPKKGS